MTAVAGSTATLKKTETQPKTHSGTFIAGLIALVVLGWSTSWIALHYQVGVVAPEISLFWRFLLAGCIMTVICLVRKKSLRGFSKSDHLLMAITGLTLFSFNFFFFYTAGQYLVSGLLSVVFALAAPGNLMMQSLILRQRVGIKTVVGSFMGLGGLMLLFAPEIGSDALGNASFAALLTACMGTVVFCTGNYVLVRVQQRNIPLLPSIAIGMFYGSFASAALGFALGHSFQIEWTTPYIISLIWSAVVSSVLAFLGYITLLRLMGAAKTGYLTVLLPVFALLISSVVEYYAWTPWAIAGLMLVGLGNILVLHRRISPH